VRTYIYGDDDLIDYVLGRVQDHLAELVGEDAPALDLVRRAVLD
jgi:hypothetical protein